MFKTSIPAVPFWNPSIYSLYTLLQVVHVQFESNRQELLFRRPDKMMVVYFRLAGNAFGKHIRLKS